jgi:UTP:GlnB (protein PII) uridylyltransferase
MQNLDLCFLEKNNDTYILKITLSENQKGIIYRVTSVLFAHGLDIIEAVAEIIGDGLVKDVFLIRSLDGDKINPEACNLIKKELNQLFFSEIRVSDYLRQYKKNVDDFKKEKPSFIQVFNPSSIDSTVLDFRTYDRPGLLFETSEYLYKKEIDIISFTAKTDDSEIRDSFLLRNKNGEKLTEEECQIIKNELHELFFLDQKKTLKV